MDTTPSLIELTDGRTLAYRRGGADEGTTLVFHHGTPGSSLYSHHLDDAARGAGLRLLTLSRPGYGPSSPRPGRRVLDVVDDTAALLAHLGIEDCLVAGASGGGPHALACAAHLPQARAALCIAGVAPFAADGLDWLDGMGQDNLDEFGAALEGEDQLRSYLTAEMASMSDLDAASLLTSLDSLLPDADRAVLTGAYVEDVVASFADSLSAGIEGWLEDDLAFAAPWGFDLAEISVPTAIWQGADDLMVPAAHGRWLAAQLPDARVHLVDGEGHLSISIGAIDQMLDELRALAG